MVGYGACWSGRRQGKVPWAYLIKQVQIYYTPPPPPLPADSCAHGTTTSPVWRLALLSFLPLSLGLAAPLWAATGNVSNLNLTVNSGFAISSNYPSALAFTTGSNSTGYTLQSVTLKLKLSALGSDTTGLTYVGAQAVHH